jgi:hypothetical protein
MFLTLLPATLIISLITCWIITRLFNNSLDKILNRIIHDEIATGWKRYLQFAIYVVGISSGVQIWNLERYIEGFQQPGKDGVAMPPPALTGETWVLEVYRAVIGTMQGIAWALLLFFLASLIAFVIVKKGEIKDKG